MKVGTTKTVADGYEITRKHTEYLLDYCGFLHTSLTDTQNGFVAKFFSQSTCKQDYFVCLDYDQAEELYLVLKQVLKDQKKEYEAKL